jgi:hypothetical protein
MSAIIWNITPCSLVQIYKVSEAYPVFNVGKISNSTFQQAVSS